MSSDEAKGLLRSLFDFSFTSLITTKIIRFVYLLIVILYTFGALGFFLAGISSGTAIGLFTALILVPLGYLVYLTLSRITMEILIVVFRMGDDIRAIRLGGGMPPGDYTGGHPGL
jgi:hypothetical protein